MPHLRPVRFRRDQPLLHSDKLLTMTPFIYSPLHLSPAKNESTCAEHGWTTCIVMFSCHIHAISLFILKSYQSVVLTYSPSSWCVVASYLLLDIACLEKIRLSCQTVFPNLWWLLVKASCSPSSVIWYWPNSSDAVWLARSGVTLAMHHRLSDGGIPTYGLSGLGKGDELWSSLNYSTFTFPNDHFYSTKMSDLTQSICVNFSNDNKRSVLDRFFGLAIVYN